MALIQSIWLPRRGKKSTMNGTKKNQVLAKGEFFTEYPDSGIGTGHGKAKMGDGVTDYEHLPYFLGDTENEKITFSSNTSGTVAAALNSVVSGATLKNIIAGLKQAIVKSDENVTKLNDDSDKKYALKNHNHDSVYAAKSHTHDDRYYTETEINNKISTLQTSFQDGVDTLYNKCVELGSTPTDKTPTAIAAAMEGLQGGNSVGNTKLILCVGDNQRKYNENIINADGKWDLIISDYRVSPCGTGGDDIIYRTNFRVYLNKFLSATELSKFNLSNCIYCPMKFNSSKYEGYNSNVEFVFSNAAPNSNWPKLSMESSNVLYIEGSGQDHRQPLNDQGSGGNCTHICEAFGILWEF